MCGFYNKKTPEFANFYNSGVKKRTKSRSSPSDFLRLGDIPLEIRKEARVPPAAALLWNVPLCGTFHILCVMLSSLVRLEEQGNTPKSRYRNQKIDDFRKERSTAARNPRNSVKREERNRTPVYSADYYEDKSYFVYDAHKKSPLQEKNLDVVRHYFARELDFYTFSSFEARSIAAKAVTKLQKCTFFNP